MDDLSTRIPHRPPYLLIERVEAVSAQRAQAQARAPQHPAQLIEVCAQAAAATASAGQGAPRAGVLLGVRRFAILRAPEPGEALRVDVRLKARLDAQALFECRVFDGAGATVAHGRLAFALTPAP